MTRRPRSSQSGFTLLEILVATTIMAVAIGGLLTALSTTMRNAARLTDYDRAAVYSRHKLEELLENRKLPKLLWVEGQWDPNMTNGKQSGWRARLSPWEWAPGSGPGSPVLERIQLEIWWMEGEKRKIYYAEGFRRGILTQRDIESGVLLVPPGQQ